METFETSDKKQNKAEKLSNLEKDIQRANSLNDLKTIEDEIDSEMYGQGEYDEDFPYDKFNALTLKVADRCDQFCEKEIKDANAFEDRLRIFHLTQGISRSNYRHLVFMEILSKDFESFDKSINFLSQIDGYYEDKYGWTKGGSSFVEIKIAFEHTLGFADTFEKLLKLAETCPNGSLVDEALDQLFKVAVTKDQIDSIRGSVYSIITRHKINFDSTKEKELMERIEMAKRSLKE